MRLQRTMITAFTIILLLYVPAYAAAYDDAGIISERIEKLPEEEITEESAKEAEQLMEAYNELSMAEKLHVGNYNKLERICNAAVRAGYIKETENAISSDQARAAMEQVTLEESANTETGTTEYIFQSSPSSDEMSIVIHYLTDINGDGEGDAPARIILISPEGVTIPIAVSNTKLLDDSMDIGLVWERTFLQLDIAYAEHGKWKISTSDPVTFSRMPYAGIRQEITANDDRISEDAEPPKEPEVKRGPGVWTVITIIALIAVLAFILRKYVIRQAGKSGRDRKKRKETEITEDRPRRMTDEEAMEQVRREMEEQALEEESMDEYEYIDDDDEGMDRTEYTELLPDEYEEGETGVLKKTENPVLSGGGLREDADDDVKENTGESVSSSIMDLFDRM